MNTELQVEPGTANHGELAGRVVLVTGAGSGIGKATAGIAVEAGATVICTDVTGHDETAQAIGATGRRLDVRSAEDWSATVEAIVAEHGRIDCLANVAGVVQNIDTAVDLTEEQWDRVISINLKGAWLGMKTVLPGMIANGSGAITSVASTAGLIGMPNVFAYSASKGGIIGMSRQAAIEYASSGIRFNVVCPGVIETPILGDITEELKSHVIAATPVGRIGRPEDIGHMISYLLSPRAAFITGQVFAVDGGWTAQ